MLQVSEFLNSIQSKKESVDEEKFVRLSYTLCKTFGWDYHTLVEQPIPFVYAMIEQLMKENKEQEKAFKKGRKK
tara:strand:+ start:343 stop:564 length:222 start_codon:yes stop_codon:yes gene_type:complete